jgi:ubiquinone/menaquinone biosynthesis C-methylase UbiE
MGDIIKYDVTEFHNNIARGYDEAVNASIPVQFIRNYFRQRILSIIKPGQHLLEIGCGTGIDAIFLANNGIKVTATDISANMLKITNEKIQSEKLTAFIKTELLDADNLKILEGNVFDGIISNFNAVNYVRDLDKFSLNTFNLLKPGAKVFFVMLNKICLWEVFYNLLKLKPVTAFERLKSREKYYKTQMQLYFPGKIKKIFSQYYRVNKITGFGFLCPPDGLSAFQKKHENFFSKIQGLENFLCSKFPFYNLCDHYLIEMTRN